MTAFRKAQLLYQAGGWRAMSRDIKQCLNHGYVFASPECIVMGFRCCASDVETAIARNYSMRPIDAREDGDCWFVWLTTGTVAGALALMPFPLPFVAFARRGSLRVWPLSRLAEFKACQSDGTG